MIVFVSILAVCVVGIVVADAQHRLAQAREWGHRRGYFEGWSDAKAGRQYGEDRLAGRFDPKVDG